MTPSLLKYNCGTHFLSYRIAPMVRLPKNVFKLMDSTQKSSSDKSDDITYGIAVEDLEDH